MSSTQISDNEIAQAVTYLQQLLRINTTNPPGNEIAACQYLAGIFDREGISYQILESAPSRASLVARLKGDGSKQPLLLTSHLDVVPCERDKWDVDPFGGEIKDDFIWGRGAVDMKQMTAMELAIFLKAHREKTPLKRDLIMAAVADEEQGCVFGSAWLVDNHPDLVRAEYALNEVGGFSLWIDDQVFYPIGVGDKGCCWFNIKAKGSTGHGALPHNDQAILSLSQAAQKLIEKGLPFHKTGLVESFVYHIARRQSFFKSLVLKATTKELLSDFMLKYVFPDKAKARRFHSMYRNLATPTMLRAGTKENVIPSEATMTVDGRVLPGQTIKEFLDEVQTLIGPGYDIEVLQANEPQEVTYQNDFFASLQKTIVNQHPGATPIPFLNPGFTDAKNYAKLGIKTYGFAPTRLPKGLDFGSLFHGHNERIPVESISFGVRVMWDLILETCC